MNINKRLIEREKNEDTFKMAKAIIATLVLVELVICNHTKYCWKYNTLEGPVQLSKNKEVNLSIERNRKVERMTTLSLS